MLHSATLCSPATEAPYQRALLFANQYQLPFEALVAIALREFREQLILFAKIYGLFCLSGHTLQILLNFQLLIVVLIGCLSGRLRTIDGSLSIKINVRKLLMLLLFSWAFETHPS